MAKDLLQPTDTDSFDRVNGVPPEHLVFGYSYGCLRGEEPPEHVDRTDC